MSAPARPDASALDDPAGTTSLIGRLAALLRREWFPSVVPGDLAERRRTAVVVAGSALVVTVVLVLWRPWPSARDVIWGEDGPIFLGQQLALGFERALRVPYNGYLHVVPRLVAVAVVHLPPAWWALGLSVASAAIRATLGAVVWYALAGHLPRWARAVAALLLVTAPLGNYETLNNACNLHWFLLAAAVPTLLWVPATWRGRVAQALVVAFAVLSDPVTCLLAPLVLLRVVATRQRRDHVVSAAFVAASALQAYVVLTSERAVSQGMAAAEIPATYAVRVVLATLGGKGGTEWAFTRFGWLAAGAAVLAVVAVLILGLRAHGPHRGVVVASAAASVALFSASMLFGIGAEGMAPNRPLSMLWNSRYSVAAVVLLATTVAAAAVGALGVAAGAWRRALQVCGVAGIAVYAVTVVLTYAQPLVIPAAGPWPQEIADACADPARDRADVHIAPAAFWVTVPCNVLRRS